MQTQRRIWDGYGMHGEERYLLITIDYHRDTNGMNVADSVEYERFKHVDQTDDPAIVQTIGDLLEDLEVHPCELNQGSNNFEIVDCWSGCELCKKEE